MTTVPYIQTMQYTRQYQTLFALDSEGRLLAEIVTIENDDDDNNDHNEKKLKNKDRTISLGEIKVKPKRVRMSESEIYETKLTENDGNKGGDLAISVLPPPPSGNQNLRNLNSVDIVLMANKTTTAAKAEHSQKESGKSLEKVQIIDMCNEDTNTVKSPSSHVNDALDMLSSSEGLIPGKGQYRIMDQIVRKNGDKNEIILRLEEQPVINKPTNCPIHPTLPAASKQSAGVTLSTETVQLTTHVNDMYTLSNMARSYTELNVVLRNRFKVRSFCTALPRNPMQWSPDHVATFVANADFEKYAKNFHDQEIDGLSLLLLTVEEIHNILGVRLVPATKIHDLILILQQLVNEAYLSKHTPAVFAALSTATNKTIPEYHCNQHVLPKSFTSKTMSVEKEGLSNDPITAAVELSREKVAKWIDNNNDTIEKIRNETAFEFKTGETSLGPSYLTKQIASAAKYGISSEVFSSSELITAQSQSFPTPRNYYPHPVRIHPFHPVAMDRQFGPRGGVMYPSQMQFIPTVSQMITDNGSDSQILEKSPQKRPSNFSDEVLDKTPKLDDSADSKPFLEPTVVASYTPLTQEIYDKHLSGVSISLLNSQLWEKFYKIGTEMILTPKGRLMFPSIKLNISGLSDYQKYAIVLDFVLVDNHRYKFEFKTSRWMSTPDEQTPTPTGIYLHPNYSDYGLMWMSSVIDFTRCKLTNNSTLAPKNILLHSMHKYQPRIHVIIWDNKQFMRNPYDPYDLLTYGCKKIFTFELTKFIAVTAYLNTQVTQLKIDSNPFARGFREEQRREKEKNVHLRNSEDNDGWRSYYREELDVPHHEKGMRLIGESFHKIN